MRTSQRKSRMQNKAAKKTNSLRLEMLESRMLLSGTTLGDLLATNPLAHADPKTVWTSDSQISPVAAAQAEETEPLDPAGGAQRPSGSINPLDTITYDTRADGLPILNSLPGAPGNIFLDFDGDAASSYLPYTKDTDGSTFNTEEQGIIVDTWRRVVDFYSMFDINVTTIQPNVATQPTSWHVITPSYSNGGLAWDIYPNTSVGSITDGKWSPYNVTEAIAHEVGHTFGSGHISRYDTLGNNIEVYATFTDPLHGATMGGSSGVVNKWAYWHAEAWYNPGGPSYLQNDMDGVETYGFIANLIKKNAPAGYIGDGYRTDDFGGTTAAAHPLDTSGTTQVHTGIIERLSDADAFSFTSAGGRYSIIAAREAPSPVDLKLSIYDSFGVLIASEDADPRDQPYSMANDQYVTVDLPAGTYYIVVQSHENYCDQGKYVVRVDPVPDANWTVDAVGLNSNPGYSSYDSATGTYTLAGCGYFRYPSTSSSIGGTADSFQFEYQKLQGDGQIIAQVSSLSSVFNPKAGIMIRDSLDSNAMSASVVLTSTTNASFITRNTLGGNSASATHSASTTYWLKLTRTGNVFRAYYSTNGTTWTQFGSNQTINMGSTVYIGLASTANLNSWGSSADPTGPQTNVATFKNVSVAATGSGVLNPTATIDPALSTPMDLRITGKTSSSISLSWGNVNGETGYRIERSTDGAIFQQIGTTAADVLTYTDSAMTDPVTGLPLYQQYFYRVRAQSAAGYSQPSIVVNSTLRAGPVSNLVVNSISTTQLVLDWTDASGETGYRIERSLDGSTGWASVGTVGKNVPSFTNSGLTANTRYYYRVVTLDATGDAATSAVASRFTRLAAVTNLAFSTKAPKQMVFQWTATAGATGYRIERSTNGKDYSVINPNFVGTTYTDNSVVPMNEYYYRVTGVNANIEGVPAGIFAAAPAPADLPSPWMTADIGSVGGTGAASYSNGTFKLIGGGGEIWGSSDQFRFVYQDLPGNGSLTARVTSVEDTNYWAKVGLMVRASTNANAKEAMIYTSPNLVVFQSRTSTGGSTSDLYGPNLTAPLWLRITRTISGSSSIIKGEYSSDGTTWTELSSRTISNMSGTVKIGFAVTARDNNLLNTSTFQIDPPLANTAPTVATAAAVLPSPVTGATANLSALGADDHGEGNLTYTWSTVTVPSGAPAPTYSVNGTNAAKNATVSFGRAGNYTFRVTIADCNGLSVTSTASVTVSQTATSVAISPASVIVPPGGTHSFTASLKDQFGIALSPQPTFTWSATAGAITTGGLFTAPALEENVTITATSGALNGTASVLVSDAPPTVFTVASASPSPVTGTTTSLSVRGADDLGEANLIYTWTATMLPPAAEQPTYSVNGTNAAKSTVATFSMAGTYVLQATITDGAGQSVTSSTSNLSVISVISSVVLAPPAVTVVSGQTQPFAATALDQFGNVHVSQPVFTWSTTAGTITTAGLYTAPASSGTATVYAVGGSRYGTATVTVPNNAPTDLVLSNAALDENQAGAAVGTLMAVDPDTGDNFAYYLENDPTGRFEIAGNVLKLKEGEELDYETMSGVELLLGVTDGGGLSFQKSFTLSIGDRVETLVVEEGDWTVAGLTLERSEDGKLHVYHTGETVDAVPPHDPAKVLGIDVTGRDLADVMTVAALGIGIPELALHRATLVLAQDNALSADTNVIVDGGAWDFAGHATAIGNLLVQNNGQVAGTAITNTTTTVESGTLTATSIVCDTLTIGSVAPVAAVSAVASTVSKAHELPTILPTTMAVEEVAVSAGIAPATPAQQMSAAPTQEGQGPRVPFAPIVDLAAPSQPLSLKAAAAPIALSDDLLDSSVEPVVSQAVAAVAPAPAANFPAVALLEQPKVLEKRRTPLSDQPAERTFHLARKLALESLERDSRTASSLDYPEILAVLHSRKAAEHAPKNFDELHAILLER